MDHVRGKPTGYISTSETASGTQRFAGGNGLVEINIATAVSGGANFIPHTGVIQGVGDLPKQIQKVSEAREALFGGPIIPKAVRLIQRPSSP